MHRCCGMLSPSRPGAAPHSTSACASRYVKFGELTTSPNFPYKNLIAKILKHINTIHLAVFFFAFVGQDECPWERLREIRQACPDVCLQVIIAWHEYVVTFINLQHTMTNLLGWPFPRPAGWHVCVYLFLAFSVSLDAYSWCKRRGLHILSRQRCCRLGNNA